MRYTAELRQKIIEEYASRHGGQWDADGFFAEVKAEGADHPAYGWFTWDTDAAALQHNLWQARTFAHGLKVKFEIEIVGREGPIKITRMAPLVLSPLAGRRSGGGYTLTDPNNPLHVAELGRQAANALASWLARYAVCLPAAGLSIETFENAVKALEGVGTSMGSTSVTHAVADSAESEATL